MLHLEADQASSQDIDDSISSLKKQVKRAPLCGRFWAQLGLTLQIKDTRYHDSGIYQKDALFAFRMAVKLLDPFSSVTTLVWCRMGLLLKAMGSFREAHEIQVSVSNKSYFPSDKGIALHYAGEALAAMNRPVRALIKFRGALSACPRQLDSYLGIVDRLLEIETSRKSDWQALLHQMYTTIGQNVISHPTESLSTFATTLNVRTSKASFGIPSAFYFAMYKAAQCLEEHEQAWWLLDKAHVAQKQEKDFTDVVGTLENIHTNTLTIRSVFNAGFWPAGVGHKSATPVFIVGMMRSGSTLLEHILDAHSGLIGIGEDSAMNHFLPSLLKQIQECMKPTKADDGTTSNYFKIKKLINEIGDKVITRMTNKALDALEINNKLDETTNLDKFSRRPVRIIDKMLFNYRNIGLIHLVFPNAIILHTIRDPMDTIFGCYKQKFDDGGLDWTMDLKSLCGQYNAYLEIMDHWEHLLPGRVHHVVYEDLVLDTEKESKRIVCDVLGLEWEDSVMDAHSRLRAVHTHSMGQVRKKIHKSAVGGWKKYAKMLLPAVRHLIKPTIRNIKLTEKFPSINWNLDSNFVQQPSHRKPLSTFAKSGQASDSNSVGGDSSCVGTVLNSGDANQQASGNSPLLGKVPSTPENPFSTYEKLIDISLNYDKLSHMENITAVLREIISFDNAHCLTMTPQEEEETQGVLMGAITVNLGVLGETVNTSFCVDPEVKEDISLYCLLLRLSRKQVYFSGCRYFSTTYNESNAVTHISSCVNKHLT